MLQDWGDDKEHWFSWLVHHRQTIIVQLLDLSSTFLCSPMFQLMHTFPEKWVKLTASDFVDAIGYERENQTLRKHSNPTTVGDTSRLPAATRDVRRSRTLPLLIMFPFAPS